MSDASGPVLAADGTPLKRSLARALRAQKIRAFLLIAPLLIFILVTFIFPIGEMLFRSVENKIVSETLPQTVIELQEWDFKSGEAPDEPVFKALAEDLQIAIEAKKHTKLGSRLNYEQTGIASLFRKSGRKISKWELDEITDFRAEFEDLDKKWLNADIWRTIQAYSNPVTAGYFLASVDRENTPDGIQPAHQPWTTVSPVNQ